MIDTNTAAEAAAAASSLGSLGGAGTIGSVLAGAVVLLVTLRPLLSRIKLSTKMDEGQINALDRLGQMLNEERAARKLAEERADRFAAERNEAIQRIGQLEGEVRALQSRVDDLTRQLGALMEKRNAPPSS